MNKKILSAFAALCVLLAATGCGNSAPAATTPAETTTTKATTTAAEEVEEEDGSEESDEGNEEDSGEEEGSDDDLSWMNDLLENANEGGDDEGGNMSEEEAYAEANALLEAEGLGEFKIDANSPTSYPYDLELGTAKKLDGNIAIVSVFANTPDYKWSEDISQDDAYSYYGYELGVATKWLEDKSKEYGHSPNFIYDWNEHPELFYKAELKGDATVDTDMYRAEPDFILNNIDTAGLLEKTDAQQVVYLFVFNTPLSNEKPSYASMWFEGVETPIEACTILMGTSGNMSSASALAHEILHTFGAPDLYQAGFFGITQEYIDYLAENNSNDIMKNGGYDIGNYESIDMDLSEIVAYYVGLTDHSDDVDQWGFEPSMHTKY